MVANSGLFFSVYCHCSASSALRACTRLATSPLAMDCAAGAACSGAARVTEPARARQINNGRVFIGSVLWGVVNGWDGL